MFHKPDSSIQSSKGKKGKDVALRKSDRRQLLQSALQSLVNNCDGDEQGINEDRFLLEEVFLKGSLQKRSIKLPSATVHLYLRSPAASSEEEEDGSSSSLWPYSVSTQCVWLQVEMIGSYGMHELPGLALLSVLTKSSNNNNNFPTVQVPYHASKYICRGANVMRPGMLNVHDAGSVTTVSVVGNPQPFAVGLLHPDVRGRNGGAIGPGTKGTGVTVVHCYGDDIWRQQRPETLTSSGSNSAGPVSLWGGAPWDAGNYGNVGFVDGAYVVPIVQEEDAADTNQGDTTAESGEAGEAGNSEFDKDGSVSSTQEAGETGNGHAVDTTNQTTGNTNQNDVEGKPQTFSESTISPEEVLHAAVCKALVSLNVKRDLPMLMSTFYAQHVLPNRPEGTTVQLKQTKYKKFGAYIAEKVEDCLLTVGPDGSKKDLMAMLLDYDRRHPDLTKFADERKATLADADAIPSSASSRRLVLVDLYCVPNHFVNLLRLDRDAVKAADAVSAERRDTGMLTLKESRAILENYIAREQLVNSTRPDTVQLDAPLTDAVFKKKNRKGNETLPTNLSRKELIKLWLECQESAFALVELPENRVIKLGRGKPPVITIEVSGRQSRKFVTRVFGLEKYGVSAESFSSDVTHRFACSGAVTPMQSNQKLSEVQFQGNLADELEALLLSDEKLTSHGGAKGSTYNLPKNAIDVVLRKGVPARKKAAGTSKKR